MNCAYCQLELKREARNCPRCGAPIESGGEMPGGADETRLQAAPIEPEERTTARSRLTLATPSAPENPPAEEAAWADAGASLGAPSIPPREAIMATSAPIPAPVDAPASIGRLKGLGLAVAAVGVVSMIIAFVTYGGSLGSIGGLIGAALYAYLPFQVAERKEWARIFIGILAILGVLGNLGVVVSALGLMALLSGIGGSYAAVAGFGMILALADAGLLIAVAVNAFGRESASWCRSVPRTIP